LKPDSSGAVLSPGIHARAEGVAIKLSNTLLEIPAEYPLTIAQQVETITQGGKSANSKREPPAQSFSDCQLQVRPAGSP
jgi:hypothetical protein